MAPVVFPPPTWLLPLPPLRQPVQRKVPQAPAGPVRPPGGEVRGPDGVLHRPVHPPRLREGIVGASQVRPSNVVNGGVCAPRPGRVPAPTARRKPVDRTNRAANSARCHTDMSHTSNRAETSGTVCCDFSFSKERRCPKYRGKSEPEKPHVSLREGFWPLSAHGRATHHNVRPDEWVVCVKFS